MSQSALQKHQWFTWDCNLGSSLRFCEWHWCRCEEWCLGSRRGPPDMKQHSRADNASVAGSGGDGGDPGYRWQAQSLLSKRPFFSTLIYSALLSPCPIPHAYTRPPWFLLQQGNNCFQDGSGRVKIVSIPHARGARRGKKYQRIQCINVRKEYEWMLPPSIVWGVQGRGAEWDKLGRRQQNILSILRTGMGGGGGSKINALRPLPHSTIAQDGQNYKMRTELKGHQQPTGSETKLKNCKKCVHGDNVIKKKRKKSYI